VAPGWCIIDLADAPKKLAMVATTRSVNAFITSTVVRSSACDPRPFGQELASGGGFGGLLVPVGVELLMPEVMVVVGAVGGGVSAHGGILLREIDSVGRGKNRPRRRCRGRFWSAHTKALCPVIALPTMRVCIWYVPSKE
jgi:hypothetical protein